MKAEKCSSFYRENQKLIDLQDKINEQSKKVNELQAKKSELLKKKAEKFREFAGKRVEICWNEGDWKGKIRCTLSEVVEPHEFSLICKMNSNKTVQFLRGPYRQMFFIENITRIKEV
ncbi:MAG: hypothetical protein PHE59_01060 [Patescibacteria group bacterium]|nr:hypothetical protein [Patescibacteria group bacterium]MDD5535059.1 hypothetical protein [Patescibacteria group bacterium]